MGGGMNPFVIVIFGATGDLAQHKLFPALFSLFDKGLLGEKFRIVSFARRSFTDDEYRKLLRDEWRVKGSEDKRWDGFARNIYYQQGYFDESSGYLELNKKLKIFDAETGDNVNRLFYLATPPDKYFSILHNLRESKLADNKWSRLAIEKPFGRDLVNARELDRRLAEIFKEKQIYRVDHYLAKETVQNVLAFRFANGIFEPVWNKNYIDHVQITFAEKEGVGSRGSFFDGIGILRDVAQNHLLQLLATITMEQPRSFAREDVRNVRADAIKAIRGIKPEDVVNQVIRGQYEGYKKEPEVAGNSTTETFAAMKLFVDTKRFENVPFYIRAGKKIAENAVEIKIVFIQTCSVLFKEYGCPEIGNVLTIRIQPNEGIGLRVVVKHPPLSGASSHFTLGTVDMKFSYKEEFGGQKDVSYETLLFDIFSGDQTLFNRSDELESSWKLISQIMEGWAKQDDSDKFALPIYKIGSWGPEEANVLIEKDGKKWL